jgi:hypothetical protein
LRERARSRQPAMSSRGPWWLKVAALQQKRSSPQIA